MYYYRTLTPEQQNEVVEIGDSNVALGIRRRTGILKAKDSSLSQGPVTSTPTSSAPTTSG
jgi:hypothetical protein